MKTQYSEVQAGANGEQGVRVGGEMEAEGGRPQKSLVCHTAGVST